jgi:hypothetical protein
MKKKKKQKQKHTTSVTKHHDRSNKTDDDEKTPHKIVDTYKTISINRLAWGAGHSSGLFHH